MTPVRSAGLRARLLMPVLLGPCLAAWAGDEAPAPRTTVLPAYRQECGACHLAYPPGLLPAPSWRRLMGGLPHHFGVDASLDAAAVRTLSAWLASNAGPSRRVREAPPEDRITRSDWFVREHGELPPSAWKGPTVKSPANCAACHAQAEQGDFDERHVRIPR